MNLVKRLFAFPVIDKSWLPQLKCIHYKISNYQLKLKRILARVAKKVAAIPKRLLISNKTVPNLSYRSYILATITNHFFCVHTRTKSRFDIARTFAHLMCLPPSSIESLAPFRYSVQRA